MRNIIDLYEASILDIEGTMEVGDKYNKLYNDAENELKKVHKDINDLNNWIAEYIGIKTYTRKGGCKKLGKFLGKEEADTLRIYICVTERLCTMKIYLTPSKYFTNYDWLISTTVQVIKNSELDTDKAVKHFMKKYSNAFSNIENFIKFVREHGNKGANWENI